MEKLKIGFAIVLIILLSCGCKKAEIPIEQQMISAFLNQKDTEVIKLGEQLGNSEQTEQTKLMLVIAYYRNGDYLKSNEVNKSLSGKNSIYESVLQEYLIGGLYELGEHSQVIELALNLDWQNSQSIMTRLLNSLNSNKDSRFDEILAIAYKANPDVEEIEKLFNQRMNFYQQQVIDFEHQKDMEGALKILDFVLQMDSNQDWASSEKEFIMAHIGN